MMEESIDIIKSGVVIRSFPSDKYILNTATGMVTIHDKESRKCVFVLSPMYYDYVEVSENV